MSRIFVLCLIVFGFIIAVGFVPINYTLGNAAHLPILLLHFVTVLFLGFAALFVFLFKAIYNLSD